MGKTGATLVELLIVLTVMGLLAAATAFSYQGWIGRYRVEKATCELYSDLMHARVLAMQTNRDHFAILEDRSYRILEDTNNNGRDDGGDILLPSFPKPVEYVLCKNGSGNKLTFDRRGLMSQARTLWFTSGSGPDCDCMKVSRSRIIMGRYEAGECRVD